MINNFEIDNLYILSVVPDKFGEYIQKKINIDSIKFLDVMDVNKKGFSLVIDLGSLERYIILFQNPIELNNLVKIINKSKKNKEEFKKSYFENLKFNIDYFENLLKTEIQKKFTVDVSFYSFVLIFSLKKFLINMQGLIFHLQGVLQKI